MVHRMYPRMKLANDRGNLPVNSAANHPRNTTTPAAMPTNQSTMAWGMMRINRKKTVIRRCFSAVPNRTSTVVDTSAN